MKDIQISLTIRLDESTVNSLAEQLAAFLKKALEQTPVGFETARERKLRQTQTALFAGHKPPEDQGLLITNREAAKMLNVSTRKLWAMQKSGELPPPIRIGRAVRWRLDALNEWVAEGCPRFQDR